MRILFTTIPLAGHFFPLVPLAWACRAAGHEVLVATSDNYVPAVLRAGLPAVPLGPAVAQSDLIPPDGVGHSPRERSMMHGSAFGRIAGLNLPGADSLVESWQPAVVVAERAEYSGPVAAVSHELPFAMFHWGIPALAGFQIAAQGVLAAALAGRGLSGLPRPDAVLNPWPPSLWHSHAAGHQSVRHIPFAGDTPIPGWAFQPRTKPRICLTLGTVLPHIEGERLPRIAGRLLESLAQLNAELILAADDSVVARWAPLPAAVRHAGRVPLAEAFRVCDGVIHHGGSGTTLTAFAAGIPQLVLPQFDDQIENAQAVADAGAGTYLTADALSLDEVIARASELIGSDSCAQGARQIAAEVAGQPSPAEVVGLLAKMAA
jgi:UDP:flavonoid glycosyltransferase YjiC (YdhE family)